MSKPTIVIAEDDFLIRDYCLVPTLQPDFDILAAVDNGKAAVAAAEEHRPDVVLLDISLPVMRGLEAAGKILAGQPNIKVLFVSSYSERAYVDEAVRIGASGFVLKSRASAELTHAIRTALSGEFYLPAHGM